MRWPLPVLFLLSALVLALVAWAPPAAAQRAEISSSVDATEIELGDTVTYTLRATSETGEAPSDPELGAHPGFTVVNSGSSPTHMVTIINGRKSERHGLTVSWTLRSDRLGTFMIGPATVTIGGARARAQAQRVSVVAPGARPRRPQQPRGGGNPLDPFGGSWDPWKGILPGFDDDDPRSDPFPGVTTDPKLSLDTARAPVAFLHATVDKTRAVVGEQITLHVYLYEDPNARAGQPSDVHEATATDFVKKSLVADETRATHLGFAMVGGRPWSVRLVRKNALFPIKAGRLTILPMSLTLPHARVGLRASETLTVDVTEPPVAGRPAGYQIGDVGDMSLSANVTPRSIDQHGAVGVIVELRGTGNMPAELATPMLPGIEWLEPQVKDGLGPMQNDRYGGTRTFSYVVRIHKDGAVDLGEIRLPYFDPASRSYGVARASLGIVQVARGAARDAGPEEADPILPGMPAARATFEGAREESFLTERPIYWGALFGSPLACACVVVLGGALRRARERRRDAAPSAAKIAKDRQRDVEAALRSNDGKAAASAVARAVEAKLLAATGVNVRGTAHDGALVELEDAGVKKETAAEILDVLRACEDARFSPEGVSSKDVAALWARAEKALGEAAESAEAS